MIWAKASDMLIKRNCVFYISLSLYFPRFHYLNMAANILNDLIYIWKSYPILT